jgi:hypothetical protein
VRLEELEIYAWFMTCGLSETASCLIFLPCDKHKTASNLAELRSVQDKGRLVNFIILPGHIWPTTIFKHYRQGNADEHFQDNFSACPICMNLSSLQDLKTILTSLQVT